MESMTGYGFYEGGSELFTFYAEIKSLNSKYLEISINLPRVLKSLEVEFDLLLRKHFNRGKIECTIDITSWISQRPISLNRAVIADYHRQIEKLSRDLNIPNSVSMDTLLTLDGATVREKTAIDRKSVATLMSGIERAVSSTLAMRKREGKALERDIINSLAAFSTNAKKIKKLSAENLKKRRTSLLGRFSELAPHLDDQRIYGEVALLVDRLDINEELVRIDDHLVKFKETIRKEAQAGKKIDFLAQELFREVNTIGSKSVSSQISHIVVDLKNGVDKIREQGRNIC